jgi:hypothetical protein
MLNSPIRKATLVSGVVLVLLGIFQLFWPQVLLAVLVRGWPILFIVIGLLILYKFWFRKVRPSALFSGLLLLLTGTFILVLNMRIIPGDLTIKELWPLFMGIVGVSLIPYGSRYRSTVRLTLIVPGIILIVLMGIFLLFSLQIVKESFAEFFIRWWPLILVGMGITLIGSGWVGRKK